MQKYLYEAKYQFSIHKFESVGLMNGNDLKVFIEYLNDMQDVSKNIDEYSPGKECKVLVVFNEMIADMKNVNPVVTELLIKGWKLNISLVFIIQSHLKVPKD